MKTADLNLILKNRQQKAAEAAFDAVLAVSGGVDSMVLLDLFRKKFSGRFFVVTIDHGIRKNSASDAAFVAAECKKIGVRCEIVKVDAPYFASVNKISQEEAARELRHHALLEKSGGATICFAHHASDQAETFLLRLFRGSGLRGLASMRVLSSGMGNAPYFRPLLDCSRAEIVKYAAKNNVRHITDETNSDTKYTRNFIRSEVMPLISKRYAGAEDAICRAAELAARDCDCLDILAQELFAAAQKKAAAATDTADQGHADAETVAQVALDAQILLRTHAAVASRAIILAFEKLGANKNISQKNIDSVLSLLAKNSGEKNLNFTDGIFACISYGVLVLSRNHAAAAFQGAPVPFAFGEFELFGKKIIIKKLKKGETANYSQKNGANRTLYFDAAKIPPDTLLRPRQNGDEFCKFGGGNKKLKSYLIDKKMPRQRRGGLICAASGKEVLFICGDEISQKVALEQSSACIPAKVVIF